jgi:hypothetical protein
LENSGFKKTVGCGQEEAFEMQEEIGRCPIFPGRRMPAMAKEPDRNSSVTKRFAG